jgi:hypothetical protein
VRCGDATGTSWGVTPLPFSAELQIFLPLSPALGGAALLPIWLCKIILIPLYSLYPKKKLTYFAA